MYRNQYFITNAALDSPPELQVTAFKGLTVLSHPVLNVSTTQDDSVAILLLGYLVNPFNAEQNNDTIISQLARNCRSKDSLFKELQNLSGRYVLLYKNGFDFIALNDVCALKQLYYGFIDNDIVLTSSPKMFLDLYGKELESSREKLEFINLKEYENNECLWFGDKSIDNRLSKVLPNHFLDLAKKQTKRIPVFLQELLRENETIEYLSELLKGSINAITKRYNVIQSLTAGWDSRVLLAAARESKEKIQFYVFDHSSPGRSNAEILVPQIFSMKLGLNFKIVKPEKIKQAFWEAFKKEHVLPRVLPRIAEIQFFHDNYQHDNTVRVSGVGGGIVKCFYGYAPNNKVDINMLMHFSGYPTNNAFIKHEIASWIDGAKKYCDDYALPLLDIFHWEQKTGNWGALYAFEQDIAIEEFCPLYNKNLLLTVVKINPKKRCKPKCVFSHTLAEHLWKDTLSEPVNPASFINNLRWLIKNNSQLDYYKFRAKAMLKSFSKN